jgi:hypothetical protein
VFFLLLSQEPRWEAATTTCSSQADCRVAFLVNRADCQAAFRGNQADCQAAFLASRAVSRVGFPASLVRFLADFRVIPDFR